MLHLLASIAEEHDWLPDFWEIVIAGAFSGIVGATIALLAAKVGADREKRIQQELASEAESRIAAREVGDLLAQMWQRDLLPSMREDWPSLVAVEALIKLMNRGTLSKIAWMAVPILQPEVEKVLERHLKEIQDLAIDAANTEEIDDLAGHMETKAPPIKHVMEHLAREVGHILGVLSAYRRSEPLNETLSGLAEMQANRT